MKCCIICSVVDVDESNEFFVCDSCLNETIVVAKMNPNPGCGWMAFEIPREINELLSAMRASCEEIPEVLEPDEAGVQIEFAYMTRRELLAMDEFAGC